MNQPHRLVKPVAAHAKVRLAAAISAILTSATPLLASVASAADAADAADVGDLGAIVVTATRRSESVSDVPYNISAVSSADIVNSGVTDLVDLAHMVPGLVTPDLGPRASNTNGTLTIRGLNASSVNAQDQSLSVPVVSTYVDETPLFANLKMTDIARVEILRGPQGTLYGSGSLGGTVRMIHNEPDLTTTEFDVTTRGSHTENAVNPSESLDFIGNLPLSDTVAVRVSGGYEKLAGFTNALSVAEITANAQPVLADPSDPLHSGLTFMQQQGVDWSNTWYARSALMWKPGDDWKIMLTYQHQTDQSGGYSQTNPAYRYDQTLYVDQPGEFQTDLGSIDVSKDVGFATASSDTSFTSQNSMSEYDLTGLFESIASYYGNYPRNLSPIYIQSTDKDFTEEARLVSKESGPWDWVAGAYYSERRQTLEQLETLEGFGSWSQLPGSGEPAGCTVQSPTCPYPTFGDVIQYVNGGTNPADMSNPDLNFTFNRHVSFTDEAIFNETSYHFTDKWQATAGGRYFWQHYAQELQQDLPTSTGLLSTADAAGFHNEIFKLNTSYEIADHTLLYLTWSEGFRRGGVNALPIGTCFFCETPALLTYKPDEARNTELGIKGSFGAGTSYTFTIYNINWSNPQIEANTVLGGFGFVTNGVAARSRGAEAELTMPLSTTTKLELGYSYTDAILTAGFTAGVVPDLVGYAGDRLPNVSKQQATAALDFAEPLADNRDFHARLDASYRSDFWTALPSTAFATDLPGFALVNARAGFGFGKAWRLDAFINNLTNAEAATSVSTVPGPEHDRAYFVGRPRTIGAEFNYSFKDH
ncbi:MAG: TonB-dependent receptor [Steroidobacteraceae bacterium]|jgi:iron complex outermembrane receptor protein